MHGGLWLRRGFDNCAKEVTLHFPEKKTLGPVFFVDTANLRAQPEYKGKATGIVTRLYAQGAGNMTFADINDGKNYIECFDYTDEVIAGYWRDERYTIPEHLLAAAGRNCERCRSRSRAGLWRSAIFMPLPQTNGRD